MKFTELTIHTSTIGSELVSDILWDYTNYGVTICDVNDIIELQKNKRMYWDYIEEHLFENDKNVLVKGYIPEDIAEKTVKLIEKDLQAMKNRSAEIELGSLEMIKRQVDGDDWIEMWKKHFRPIEIGGVVICPEWIHYENIENKAVLKLDSNMAFGTGEHATTSMCIELLQKYLKDGDEVIDVGCGSGILGIAAALLGAKKCTLTDIDYVAVKSAEYNAKLNNVNDKVIASLSDLLEDTSIQGDIMLANITAEILVRLSDSIPKNLKSGGVLILSGIIDTKVEMVEDAFKKVGCSATYKINRDGWHALAFRKN